MTRLMSGQIIWEAISCLIAAIAIIVVRLVAIFSVTVDVILTHIAGPYYHLSPRSRHFSSTGSR